MLRGGGSGRRGPGGRGMDVYAAVLLVRLLQTVADMPRKPPVTLSLLAACLAVFFADLLPWQLRRLVPALHDACLQPAAVLRGEWARLVWAALFHADELHLAYNMTSLVWKGARLEARLGSPKFALLTLELLALSHGAVVASSALLARAAPEYRPLLASRCAVGLSAVLFAYKAVLNHNDPSTSVVLGVALPTKHLAWAELALASAVNPGGFLGHLCGVCAGLLHVTVADALRRRGGAGAQGRAASSLAAAAWRAIGGAGRPRFTGGGASGSGLQQQRQRQQQQQQQQQQPWRQQPQSPRQQPPSHQQQQQPQQIRAAAAAAHAMAAAGASAPPQSLPADELRRRRLARFQP